MTFSNFATLQFDLDDHTDKASVLQAINEINYAGGFTNTSGGLRVLRNSCFGEDNGDRIDVPNIAISKYYVTSGVLSVLQKSEVHRSYRWGHASQPEASYPFKFAHVNSPTWYP